MNEGNIVHQTELSVSGKYYKVQVFRRDNGRCYSLSHLDDGDVIIIDGNSVDEVLERHRFSLPIAIDCRDRWPRRMPIKYAAQFSRPDKLAV